MNFEKTAPKTVPETARALGISRHTVRAWIAQRRIGYLKLGRSVRIPQEEINRILRESAMPAVRAPQQHETATEARGRHS